MAQNAGIEEPPRIDSYVTPWTPEETDSLLRWDQGCLLAGAAWTWAVPSGPKEGEGTLRPEVWEFEQSGPLPGWSIITSQTCDIRATGPGARHPFVQVSPLVPLARLKEGSRGNVLAWKVVDMAPVTIVPDGQEWVADLRVSVPVSKSLLIASTPVDGYANDSDRLRFAEHVAGKYRRPALANALSEGLKEILADVVQQGSKKNDDDWHERVEQVRLELAGDRLRPSWVRPHLICERALTRQEKALWRTGNARLKKLLAQHDIAYAPMAFDVLDDVRVKDWRAWVPLPVPGHSGTYHL